MLTKVTDHGYWYVQYHEELSFLILSEEKVVEPSLRRVIRY